MQNICYFGLIRNCFIYTLNHFSRISFQVDSANFRAQHSSVTLLFETKFIKICLRLQVDLILLRCTWIWKILFTLRPWKKASTSKISTYSGRKSASKHYFYRERWCGKTFPCLWLNSWLCLENLNFSQLNSHIDFCIR